MPEHSRSNQPFSGSSIRVALIAVFTALSLGTNYVIVIPNVKLMDALIFIAAFLFGLEVGVWSAITTRFIYGFVNPWGQVDFITLSFLIIGECFYAVAGFLLSRVSAARDLMSSLRPQRGMGLLFGVIGFQATFAFDVLTNFGTYFLKTSTLYEALIIGMITGAPFGILHEVSNLVFFATVVPVAIVASKRLGFTTTKNVS